MGRKFRNSKVVGTKNWRLGSLWGHWHSAAFLVCALLHIVQHMASVHGCLSHQHFKSPRRGICFSIVSHGSLLDPGVSTPEPAPVFPTSSEDLGTRFPSFLLANRFFSDANIEASL